MKLSVWNKKIVVQVEMHHQDVADWNTPLPLFIQVQWHHYIGFYFDIITEFFAAFIPYPHLQNSIALKIPSTGIVLDGTQIISHIFSLYFQENSSLPLFQCHFRQNEIMPTIDLMRHYKQNLKASTCIRYGKFGAAVITVDMSVDNIGNMFKSFQNGDLKQFLGEIEQQSTKLGYRFIIQNKEKIESIPVRIMGKGWRVERSILKGSSLKQFWENLVGDSDGRPKLHGVELRQLDIAIQKLEEYCHPDGYLYFTF